jgi:hypothetical protein
VARLFGGFMGLALDLFLGLIVVFCAVLLVLRFFVLPEIDSYRGRIVHLLEQQIGKPDQFSRPRLADGWNPGSAATTCVFSRGQASRCFLRCPM